MTTLQEYLNQKYPSQEDKEKVEVINTYRDISNSKRNKLKEGNLDLSEYPNLTKLEIDGSELSEKLTNLNLGPKPKLREFYCPNNHLSNLDLTNCPVLEKLDCSNNQLTELDISQLKKLTTLDCGSNQLRELDALKCPNLKVFKCSNNFLNNLDLNKNGKLEILDISDNDFTEQDLSFLSHLVNLRLLWIHNKNLERIQEEVYNRFAGSLEPLKNMAKLKNIRFSNTDLSEGLEYLTNNLERLECSANERENAKTKILAQKLTKFGEPNNLGNFVHLLRIWKEFNGSAQQWLDEWYPENEECKRKNDRLNKGKTREEITNLDLSCEEINKNKKEEEEEIKLKGGLRLKGFTSLQKLSCSGNQLTRLDLTDCSNLIEFKCDHNELHDLNFLEFLDKLESLWIQNNQELVAKNLDSLIDLTSLKELNVSDCPRLKGSLKFLEKMNKLEKVNITATNISEGLEYLPKSCERLYCNSDWQYKSIKIAEELDKSKSKRSKDKKTGKGKIVYYDLNVWREDKANKFAIPLIPTERLFTIRINIKKFLGEWGQKSENSPSKLSELQSPEEFNKFRYVSIGKWASRATSATGGVLALTGQPIAGGALAAASPFVEAITSHIEENWYEAEEKKWDEFIRDTDTLLDIYDELLEILEPIEANDQGEVNKALKNLKEKTYKFLKKYDENEDKIISTSELDEARKKITKDLRENWDIKEKELKEIMEAIRKLAKSIFDHHKVSSSKGKPKKTKEQSKPIEAEQKKEQPITNFTACYLCSQFSSWLQNNWKQIHPNFTEELKQKWEKHGFSYEQVKEWVSINTSNEQGQAIQEPTFYAYLRDAKQLTSEKVLNEHNLETLKQKFQTYQQNQQTPQIIHKPT